MPLQDLQNDTHTFDPTSFQDTFLEQMLSGLQSAGVSWPDISTATGGSDGVGDGFDLFDDQSAFLTTKLRQHQISAGDSGMFQNDMVDASIQALFNGFTGSLQPNQIAGDFQYPTAQSYIPPGPATTPANQRPTTVSATAAGGGSNGPPTQPRQRVRARRGQATDPHSIAERLRRERIAERMKSLQELVPNANKTDKASMLDEIIDYVKFLQLQVKVLSMSRMGGVAAVAPLVTDGSSEGGRDGVQVGTSGGAGQSGGATTSTTNDTMTVAENRVVKLMEEDMGSAMQYLQGKGLCLMPISLATAISTVTTTTNHHSSARNNHPLLGGEGGAPSSSNLPVLSTVQPANGVVCVKDSTALSKS